MESLPDLVDQVLGRDDLAQISKEGFDLVARRHTTDNRVKEIIEIISKDYYGERKSFDEDLYFHYDESKF